MTAISPNLDHARKRAKALLRAHRAGEPAAVARAWAVLGARVGERFVLADAQHVIAREAGAASWRELRATAPPHDAERHLEHALRAPGDSRRVVEPGPRYAAGGPVRVWIHRREHRYDLTDDARAVELAGHPDGWRAVALAVVERHALNLDRRGAVFVPAVVGGFDLDTLAGKLADCSAAVHDALLEADDPAPAS